MVGPSERNPRFRRLADWLAWQETLHPNAIDLGLDRLQRTLDRLGWQRPACPVITVAGTNGKGSCVALTARIVREAGSFEVFLQDGLGQEGESLQHRFVVEVFELHFGPGKGFPVIRNLPGSLGQSIKPAGTKLPEMRRRAPLLSPAAQRSVVQVPEIRY